MSELTLAEQGALVYLLGREAGSGQNGFGCELAGRTTALLCSNGLVALAEWCKLPGKTAEWYTLTDTGRAQAQELAARLQAPPKPAQATGAAWHIAGAEYYLGAPDTARPEPTEQTLRAIAHAAIAIAATLQGGPPRCSEPPTQDAGGEAGGE
jgi:hypothetical protein